MKIQPKGFAGIAALIAVVIAIIVGGAYVMIKQNTQAPTGNFNFTPPATTTLAIAPSNVAKIVNPAGGEKFKVGQIVRIVWNNVSYSRISIQIVGNVRKVCSEYTNNGSMATCRGHEIYIGPNNGFYDWTIGPEYTMYGGDYLISIGPDKGSSAENLIIQRNSSDSYIYSGGFITILPATTTPVATSSDQTLKIFCNSDGCNVSGVKPERSNFHLTENGKQVEVLVDIETKLRLMMGTEKVQKWADLYPLIDGPILGGMPFMATIYGDWIDDDTFKADWIKWSIG